MVVVRPEVAGDAEAIFEVHRNAFDGDVEGQIVDKIRMDPSAYVPGLSLVAEWEGRAVGHVLLSRVTHDRERDLGLLALGPIGVVKELHRRGVGAALMRGAIDAATQLGYDGIVLIGHPEYYPRFGFVPASSFGIALPFDVPSDVAMALPLRPGSLAHAGGSLAFPRAFGGT